MTVNDLVRLTNDELENMVNAHFNHTDRRRSDKRDMTETEKHAFLRWFGTADRRQLR